jgi:PAS domain S-box-containing protein
MTKDQKDYAILVVEDNPGDSTLIKSYLLQQIASPNIYFSRTWREATAFLQVNKVHLDIILLDLSLPDKNGEPLINEAVSLADSCPIIVLTGYADIDFSIKSIALGITDYLLKDDINTTSLYKSIVLNIERCRLQKAVQESENRYKYLFKNSPVPIIFWDFETLQIIDCNEEAELKYGYSRDELVTMKTTEIRPAEDVPNLLAATISKEEYGKVHNRVWRHKKKNGEIMMMDVFGRLVEYEGKTAVINQLTDVTDKIRNEELLDEQNRNLAQIGWDQNHMARAPLANVMGLVNLMNSYKGLNVELGVLIDYLEVASNDLDNVIKKISNLSGAVKSPL